MPSFPRRREFTGARVSRRRRDAVFYATRQRSRLWDVDGNEYIDYVGSWGPMILGHAHPKVVRAVQEAARNGTSFGTPNPLEIRLARLVCEAYPSIQKLRFVNRFPTFGGRWRDIASRFCNSKVTKPTM